MNPLVRWPSLRSPSRLVAAAVVAALVLAGLIAVSTLRDDSMTVQARFASTPGLYPGNRVAVLGVPKGTVTAVEPKAGFVEVTIEVPASLALPAEVTAIIDVPNPVSARTIELYPAYGSGPRLIDGATIPLDRTLSPLPIDEVLGQLDDLAVALGPDPRDPDGPAPLGDAVGEAARLAAGNGSKIRQTLASVAQILPQIVGKPGDLSKLLTSLDRLTTVLAAHDDVLDSVIGTIKEATAATASQRQSLSQTLVALDSALGDVTTFVDDNRSNIKDSLSQLQTILAGVTADQESLTSIFRTAPLSFENVTRAIDLNTPCADDPEKACPSVFARVVLAPGTTAYTSSYCRDLVSTLIPFVTTFPGLRDINPALKLVKPPTTTTALCLAQHAVFDGRNESTPGALPNPSLDLERYLR